MCRWVIYTFCRFFLPHSYWWRLWCSGSPRRWGHNLTSQEICGPEFLYLWSRISLIKAIFECWEWDNAHPCILSWCHGLVTGEFFSCYKCWLPASGESEHKWLLQKDNAHGKYNFLHVSSRRILTSNISFCVCDEDWFCGVKPSF